MTPIHENKCYHSERSIKAFKKMTKISMNANAITANSYHKVLKKVPKSMKTSAITQDCYHSMEKITKIYGKQTLSQNRYDSVEKKIKIHESKCYHSEELSQCFKQNGQNQGTQRYQSVEKEMTKNLRKQALGLRWRTKNLVTKVMPARSSQAHWMR